MRLADWDGDGDVDVLLADAGPELLVTFYESLANESFQAHELLRLPLEDTPVDIEVLLHLDVFLGSSAVAGPDGCEDDVYICKLQVPLVDDAADLH